MARPTSATSGKDAVGQLALQGILSCTPSSRHGVDRCEEDSGLEGVEAQKSALTATVALKLKA